MRRAECKGASDAQTFPADFDALEVLTRTRAGWEARLFPGLTHIFTLTATNGPADVNAIRKPAHVAEEVVDAIAGWVARTSGR